MTAARKVARGDILPMSEYGVQRVGLRRELSALRATRRVEVGPFVTFSFECYRTIWHQIHEMLFIEKGGDAQIDGELDAYNPLIPNGQELVATMLIEIEDPVRRAAMLAKLGHVEETIAFRIGALTATAEPERDEERTTADGKTSSVHFLHFPFSAEQIAAFRAPGAEVILSIGHPEYRHMTVLSEAARTVLAGDFA
jgi:hypothetical protein